VEQSKCDMLLVVDMVYLFDFVMESALLLLILLLIALMVCLFSRFRVL